MRLSEERYISLLTDFGFKQELREYETSVKQFKLFSQATQVVQSSNSSISVSGFRRLS